ncbi:SDR family oxidoreductase [Halorientalis regularis]|jgi:NADP-dependent 3-hydroxy acid dehydrogenase YdfG|uniref:NADP-dependent 3-hydroxy acid dehydrogenase YdfG n=1 Tax=Halorientalis regularis TaxID=660518 RepID=A0A1G7J7K5_9EURY|nr:SDR family oxidoreductase [Halorientalis regularis]SDF20881.1 NADP-dependent 3-hydroxy acid dehydrogenase YdfG [Halorientalis regularis]
MLRSSLDGDTAVVTGASAGIGRATAHALAREGANVVLAARSEDRLDDIAATVRDEYDTAALVVPTDVTDEDAVAALIDATVEEFGGLDVLVNNAGLARGGPIEDMSTEQYRTMMDTNVDGMFFAARAAIPHLRDSGGTLVFLGSFAGEYPRPSNPVYAASKWWTRGFAKSLSAQVGDDFAVTVVNPAEVRTEFGYEEGTPFEERFDEGEASEPAEIAEAIVFAAKQSPSMAAEIDLYRRDKFEMF